MTTNAQHTPGPWEWFGNAKTHSIYLATRHSGRRYVMGFQRWGMKGAQPMFQPANRGLVPAKDLLQFEVGDRDVVGVNAAAANESVYRLDIRGVDCADARLIAAAPDFADAAPDAAAILEHYAEYVRGLPSAEFERHPYIPAIEEAAAKLRAAILKATGEPK